MTVNKRMTVLFQLEPLLFLRLRHYCEQEPRAGAATELLLRAPRDDAGVVLLCEGRRSRQVPVRLADLGWADVNGQPRP